MGDFAVALQAYEAWRRERGNDWHSPARYEEWLELVDKAEKWDQVVEAYNHDGGDLEFVVDALVNPCD